ncbi:hypothetical protein HAX54_037783 [Datura stramonium]|uniref:Uncharacterized protein n=1 Tax=Datura stramonium TaxID=4076 RepID=A0ABS8SHI6_DATST|nr:hypothetical protein [Datura stramonium]
MERRSTFRFRLPWSQSEPEPPSKPSTQPDNKTGPNRTTRQVTRSRTTSQPSSSTAPTTSPSSNPTPENTTRKQPPRATTRTTSGRPSSSAQPSANTQGRSEAPASTTPPPPRSPQRQLQNSAETKAPSQPTTTSSSALPETPAIPPQPTDESKAPIQSTTSTSPLPESSPVPSQPSAESKAPIQPSTTNTSRSPETTPVLPQSSSEIKAPIQSSTTNTKPTSAPASPKSETQTPTPTSTISQSPQSSPPGVAPSGTESQPLIPSRGITSQSASSYAVETKSNVSQPSSPSPSRPTPQSREMSPKSSPTRKGPQVLSTDKLTPKAATPVSQTSSNLPFGITSQEQPKDQTISQPTSPPKKSQQSSETSSKSTGSLTSISEKEPTPATVWPQLEQMELLKKEVKSDTLTDTKDRSPEKVMQPSELSEMRSTRGITEGPSKISDSSRTISEPKTGRPLETNIQETREVKEVVQETRDKNYGAGEKIGGFLTSKEQPGIVFQSKQAYTEKQDNSDSDQIRVNRVSNGKQTRTISSQLRNKTVVSGSKEAAVSAEQDIPLNKEIKDNISKFIHRMAVGDGKQNLEVTPVSVITLAGDNRGATMQLGSDSSRKGAIHIHRGYKLKPDESADATTDAEGNSEGRRPRDARTMKDQEIKAYINCNVQGLNNSITFDSSIEGKNPGIHMSFPRMPSEPTKSSERTELFEAHKAEFNVTHAQMHTYKPTIRRRCLEGLFFEPTDSDSDNPEKPRRHGCQVGSMEKRDNERVGSGNP